MATTPQLNFWPPRSEAWVRNVQTEWLPNLLSRVNPTQWRWATTLFSDEQEKYDLMIGDGLDDTTARSLITRKRKSMLADISPNEVEVLRKMQSDWLDSETATKIIKENRYRDLPLWKKALKIPFDLSVWATSLATEQVWGALGFVTGWQVPYFKEQVEWVKEVTWRSFEWQPWFQAGRNIFWTWEFLAVWPSKVAPTLWGRMFQWAKTLWAIWAIEPILEKWADVTPWEIIWGWLKGAALWAVATPIIEKALLPIISKTLQKTFKFGKAWIKWWVPWLAKSITRDIKRPFKKIKLEWLAPESAAKLSTKANRFNAKDIEDFKRITWESPWEFAVKRWMTKVWDEAVEETTKLWKRSMKEADDAIWLIDGNFKVTKWADFVDGIIKGLQDKLTKFSPDIKKVNLWAKKYDFKGLNMTEINELKRLYARKHTYSWEQAMWKSANTSRDLQDGLRKWQFDIAKKQWLKNLDKINKTTQGWRQFSDSLWKKLKRSSGNNNLSLTDWVVLSGWEPTNIAMYFWKKVWELTPVKRALIKTLWKQTKPSIIKATRESILQANIKKRGGRIGDILRDRISGKSTPLFLKPRLKALPQKATGTSAIITPQTAEKAVIQESKKWLERTKFGTTKTTKKVTPKVVAKKPVVKKPTKPLKKAPTKKAPKKLSEEEIIGILEKQDISMAKEIKWLKKAEAFEKARKAKESEFRKLVLKEKKKLVVKKPLEKKTIPKETPKSLIDTTDFTSKIEPPRNIDIDALPIKWAFKDIFTKSELKQVWRTLWIRQYKGSFGNGFFQIKWNHSWIPKDDFDLFWLIKNIKEYKKTKFVLWKIDKSVKTNSFMKLDDGVIINKKYFDKIKKVYPKSEIYTNWANNPVILKKWDEMVWIVMPQKGFWHEFIEVLKNK